MSTRIYLDNNATTRPLPEVVEAISRHLSDSYANPGSRHAEGRIARRALEEARETIAGSLGADPEEVIFTSGGTEAANMALFGFARQLSPGVIALTYGEHPATRESTRELEAAGWKSHWLGVDSGGLIRTEHLDAVDWSAVKLASVILAHNETGVIQDLGDLSRRCRAHGIPLHVDAVQAVGKIPVHFHDLGAAALSLGAHKFHGPRGIGALLVREDVRLLPSLFGGHQEAGRRPGTEPVALAVGMAKALELWHTDRERRTAHLVALRDRLHAGLQQACGPAVLNGAEQTRLPNTLSIAFPGVDAEALLVALDLAGIACSMGSTCASGSSEPAPALVAMGTPEEVYRSSIRFSVSIENTAAEIDEAVQRIARTVNHLRSTTQAG